MLYIKRSLYIHTFICDNYIKNAYKTKVILIYTIVVYKAILSPYKPIIYYSGIFYQVIILKPCINLKKA